MATAFSFASRSREAVVPGWRWLGGVPHGRASHLAMEKSCQPQTIRRTAKHSFSSICNAAPAQVNLNVESGDGLQPLQHFLLSEGLDAKRVVDAASREGIYCIDIPAKVQPLFSYLLSLGLALSEVEVMLMRCPFLLTLSVEHKVRPAVDFLRGLGLDEPCVRGCLYRFPAVLGYGVKDHLVPQLAYLKSLGVTESGLPLLIASRPQVLGEGIEYLIKHIQRVQRIKRHQVGSLLKTYPFDYSVRLLGQPRDLYDDP